ncbi:MAG: hypothetical protein QOF06_2142 [Solirubrobacterales bacterium]|nr:hypothetical protein [Solirubrobacterales bacterium]
MEVAFLRVQTLHDEIEERRADLDLNCRALKSYGN